MRNSNYTVLQLITATLFMAMATLMPCMAADSDDLLPAAAAGTFVQRKVLSDVGVTLTSRGRFRFEKNRFFEWTTLEPVQSVFLATPTNYAITVNGRTTAHALNVDVTSIAKIFEIKEMKEYVKKVKVEPETGFPHVVKVVFRNGDRLEIEMKTEP